MNWMRMMDTSLNELCKEQENKKQSRFRRGANSIIGSVRGYSGGGTRS